MICLKLINPEGEIILNSFPDNFILDSKEFKKSDKYRHVQKSIPQGMLEILVLEEERISHSNKVFNSVVNCVENLLKEALKITSIKAEKTVDEYLHNIIKIHGNQKNILERCTDGAEGQENYREYVEAVKQKIINTPEFFAEDICSLSKEVRLVDYHLGGYNLLHDNHSRVNITNNHNLRKFLLGLSHLFFDSFNDNNVNLNLHNINPRFNCSFEYETFNIAMHSFLENTIKYSKPYTTILAYTNDDNGDLVFEMESIRIDKDEIFKIMERGVSGKHVPGNLRGKGIGMYQLKKAINRSGIKFNVYPDPSVSSSDGGISYIKNVFIFNFPKFSL